MSADNTFDKEELAEIAASLYFLSHRETMARLLTAAVAAQLTGEIRDSLDRILTESEDVTRDLLLRPWKYEMDYLDEVFDDEFLDLCLIMRVDLMSWIRQPEMLMRLVHPDDILMRYANIATAAEADFSDMGSSATFSEKVAETEKAMNASFEILKRRGLV